MDNLNDLLKAKKPQEPPQLQALKDYVKTHHSQDSRVAQSHLGYNLTVNSAVLASTLQMEVPLIVKECNLDKKLFIRIGHF